MAFSVDTSYLMNAWTAWYPWYPYEEFAGVWQVLASAAAANRLFVVDRVYDELKLQVPDLISFFDAHATNWRKSTGSDIHQALSRLEADLLAGRVIRDYPKQNVAKYIQVADPLVVLHAERHAHVVVSSELSDKVSKKGPKIPDLCELRGVAHVGPSEFAQTWGYEFHPKATPTAPSP